LRVKVLFNLYSNRWNAKSRWNEVETALQSAGLDFDLAVSERPDHLADLSADAIKQGFSTLVIAGGDGSISEVVNGAGREWGSNKIFLATLGILPIGTANDLSDNIGLPRDLNQAACIISKGWTRAIDLGKCNHRYFLNNSAAGLEPYVTIKQERIKWIKGMPSYLLAAIQGIMDKPERHANLVWDGGSYEGPISLISIGNGPRTGGIFFMSPHADPFDGKLTFTYGYRDTRIGLFQALPRAMKPGEGSFVEMDGMHEFDCRHLKIHLDKPSPVHADGELFENWLTDLEYRIYPGAVQVLMP
jgi:diacylglycerol kinase (ATP)